MFDKNVPNRDEVRKGCHLCGDGYAIMMSSLKWESQMIHAEFQTEKTFLKIKQGRFCIEFN